jgi:hypothetical protein
MVDVMCNDPPERMPRCNGFRTPRRVQTGLVTMLMIFGSGLGLINTSVAHSETAGDFVQQWYLYEAESISPYPYDYYTFHETEGWSKNGTGNCNGVSNSGGGAHPGSGSWVGSACIGDGSAPDAVYCRSSCANKVGYPFVHNHSASRRDYFTGWLYAY